VKFSRAHDLRDINSSDEKDFHLLLLSQFLPISQKLFHAVAVVDFQKVFKALLDPKLLVLVSQNADVNDGEKVVTLLLQVVRGTSDNDDELLFCLGSELKRYSFG